ncbi:hypothetical protein GGR58DRAFT_263038 [Xylaria digitata]|nr:hypothetical protein GGR58DRAFT_263038 [Xylaria digitata]
MNERSKPSKNQYGSGRDSNSTSTSNSNSGSSSYHIQRWGGETRREEPWRGGDSRETPVDRAKTRINNFDKRWDQSRWRWNCCRCASGNNSYTYDWACPMCGQRRCNNCLVQEVA